ncbi:MAG: type II secretion system F family protein [Planctomycetes bacterium]|nr:type II secretion system F family protein [Planctomycetota bacterium]
MTYQYTAQDPLGKVLTGAVEATSLDDAQQQLRRDGFKVMEMHEGAEDDASGLFARRVSKSDVIFTTNQLAIMVETGITLSEALGGILQQEENPTLRKVLSGLKSAVESGESFSSALASYPKLFDRTYVSLVKASEASGSLGPMLDRIAGYLRKEVETRSKIRGAMAYPLVMMLLATGVTIFLLTYVLPKFTPLFESKGVDLPKPTLIMIGLSNAILGYWYWWVAGLAAVTIGFLAGRRTVSGRKLLDQTKINIPIIGPMLRKVAISRSIRTLGTMLAADVPMLDAIRLAGDVSGNQGYEELWKHVHDQVTSGRKICESLAGNPLFPRVLIQMIGSGEETGKLDLVLEKVSTFYDHEVETAVKTATSLIEPLLICAMGFVVGGIGLALLLPIFSLSKHP